MQDNQQGKLNKQTATEKMKDIIEKVLDAAWQHGEDEDPDHEVGDLQDHLRAIWGILTPAQKVAYVCSEQCRELLEIGDSSLIDQIYEIAQIAYHEVSYVSAYEQLLVEFEGLVTDNEVNGGDLVEWMSNNMDWIKRGHDAIVAQQAANPEPTAPATPA